MNRPAKPASEIARSEPVSRNVVRDIDRPLRLLLTAAMTATVVIFGLVSYLSYRHYAATVADLDHDAILWNWLADTSNHLIFGVSATLLMFVVGMVALRRTRRASQAHAQLQREVRRREVMEQALRQAQKMEAVGRLTGGIAHDFNNLLTAILGNVDLALRRSDEKDERLRRSLNSARQASERAAALVQRLLAFSRQHPLEEKSVNVNKLVHGMSELLRRTIGETITVESDLADGLWDTAIDPNQLENAILNLAVNARDAMPKGGRLMIDTDNVYLSEDFVAEHGEDLSPGPYVMLAVTDTGTGMSKETLDRAFEPFFTTKPSGAGTGLGLSMVYGFVKQSAGHIELLSEPGKGTSIRLYFARLMDGSALETWKPAAASPQPIDANQPETILLVEDDEEVNRFGTEVLQEEGYNVISTHEASSALRLLDGNPDIRMLFTDVVLPGGMNGKQLADEALRRRPKLKVLFATGYTRDAIVHHGRIDADVDLLTKPFTPDALTGKVRQILDTAARDPVVRAEAVIGRIKDKPQSMGGM